MTRFVLVSVCSCLLGAVSVQAQQLFTRHIIDEAKENARESVIWLDESGDGLYDLIFERDSKIYINEGDGSFSISPRQLPEIGYVWIPADYDQNGTTDILNIIGGEGYYVLLNQANGGFEQQRLPINDYSTVLWSDVEADGDFDLLYSNGWEGSRRENYNNRLYAQVNQGNNFNTSNFNFKVQKNDGSDIAYFHDFDRDGDQDLMVTNDDVEKGLRIYRNKGQENFELDSAFVTDRMYSRLFFEDVNNDGFTDVLWCYRSGFVGKKIVLLLNKQNLKFEASPFEFEGMDVNTADFGDYDNDGLSDILIASGQKVLLYHNQGSGTFVKHLLFTNNGTFIRAFWMDINGDGFLDYWIEKPSCWYTTTGCNTPARISFYLNNATATANNPPATPLNLRLTNQADKLEWDRPDGDETAPERIQYNLLLKRGSEKVVFPYPLAKSTSITFSPIANRGSVNFYNVSELAAGTYTASVQSVDGGYKRSPFSEELGFTIEQGPVNLQAHKVSYDSILFSWESPLAYDQLVVERSVGEGEFTLLATVEGNQLQYLDKALPAADSIRYRVKGVIDQQRSAFSPMLRVVVAPFEFTRPFDQAPPRGTINAWADFNNDGMADMVAYDYPNILIYKRLSVDKFELLKEFPDPESAFPNLSWVDVNEDNMPDLSIRYNNVAKTIFYLNDGAGGFNQMDAPHLDNLPSNYSHADYDQDGVEELIYLAEGALWAQEPGNVPRRMLYRFFDDASFNLFGSVYVRDFSGDGYTDILFLGSINKYLLGSVGQQYTVGSLPDNFEYQTVQLNPGLAFGDLNDDGVEDAVYHYYYSQSPANGMNMLSIGAEGLTTEHLVSRSPGFGTTITLADFNNDGQTDLEMAFVYGETPEDWVSPVLYMRSNGGLEMRTFSDRHSMSDISNFDFDVDGDLDLVSGLLVLKNNSTELGGSPNQAPTSPPSPQLTLASDEFRIEWEMGSDAETAAASLTYNYYLHHDDRWVRAPFSDVATGRRFAARPGNNGFSRRLNLQDLAAGEWRFAVQSIDNGFAASGFSNEVSFTVREAPVLQGIQQLYSRGVKLEWAPVDWATDYTVKRALHPAGPYTIIASLKQPQGYFEDIELAPNTRYYYKVTAYSSTEVSAALSTNIQIYDYQPLPQQGLPDRLVTQGELADINNDGWLDLAIAGDFDGQQEVRLYKNRGDASFEYLEKMSLENKINAIHWTDMNGDNRLDLAVATKPAPYKAHLFLFEQDPQGKFVRYQIDTAADYHPQVLVSGDFNSNGTMELLSGAHLVSGNGSAGFQVTDAGYSPLNFVTAFATVDFDNDLDMDVITGGSSTYANTYATIMSYENSGFVLESISPNLTPQTMEVGDFNADGKWDLAVFGGTATGFPGAIYTSVDTTYTIIGLPFAQFGSATTTSADYDNNGKTDIFISGSAQSAYQSPFPLIDNQILSNTGDTTLINTDVGIVSSNNTKGRFGDLDNDGDLDLVMVNQVNDTLGVLVYLNTTRHGAYGQANVRPAIPEGLNTTLVGDTVRFSWLPSSDLETPAVSLTYNMYLKGPGGIYRMPPMADDTVRRVVAYGNAGLNTMWKLHGLPAGIYYWSVQAVDAGYTASEFAPEQSFEVIYTGIRSSQADITLYPNPAQDELTLRLGSSEKRQLRELAIIDQQGVVLKKLMGSHAGSGDVVRISLDGITSGVYFLFICDNQGCFTRKFIKR